MERGRRCWSRGFAGFGLRGLARVRGGERPFPGLGVRAGPAVVVGRQFVRVWSLLVAR